MRGRGSGKFDKKHLHRFDNPFTGHSEEMMHFINWEKTREK